MKISEVEQRLKMLVKLCVETEPSIDDLKKIHHGTPEVTELFTQEMIEARQIYRQVKDGNYDSSDEITVLMTQANVIWRLRNKIKEIGWEEYYSVDYKVIELLKLNQKINAIKEYRHHQIKVMGKECGLKEAKEYVDALQIKLGLRY